jgi:hypothetical protein
MAMNNLVILCKHLIFGIVFAFRLKILFMKKIILFFFITLVAVSFSQEKKYKVSAIGFYNFENLFDTINDPNKNDDDFTPEGTMKYTQAVYFDKLEKLSSVVVKLGTELTPDGLAVLGVAEIENTSVLEDFAKHPNVAHRNYKVIHYESPDFRGIDVALLYNPKYFTPQYSETLTVELARDGGGTYFTRDILYVFGLFDGEPMHFFVNHWPSRRGGAASSPKREYAASVAKAKIDSIVADNPDAKIILMGDLNDDPTNASVRKVLGAEGSLNKVKRGGLFNPFYDMYKKGIGTLAYNDVWNLFDQIIVSSGFTDEKVGGYKFHKAKVFNEPHMYQQTGRYKGYPFRSYSFGQYIGGYSDHFPTYIYLLKEIQ